MIKVTYDESKRQKALTERGLDFADAAIVLGRRTLTLLDDRKDYGERRFQSFGYLNGRVVMIVWTPREGSLRIISMRFCHGNEEKLAKQFLG